jgi:hypothetical protein
MVAVMVAVKVAVKVVVVVAVAVAWRCWCKLLDGSQRRPCSRQCSAVQCSRQAGSSRLCSAVQCNTGGRVAGRLSASACAEVLVKQTEGDKCMATEMQGRVVRALRCRHFHWLQWFQWLT